MALYPELIRRLIVFLERIVYLPAEITAYYNELVEQVVEEANMPYISLIERRGIELGREEGLEQGIGQGRAATLHKQLQLKFGDLAGVYEARLKQADAAELDLWTERVLFADSEEAVFA